jgi:hypothetical protein
MVITLAGYRPVSSFVNPCSSYMYRMYVCIGNTRPSSFRNEIQGALKGGIMGCKHTLPTSTHHHTTNNSPVCCRVLLRSARARSLVRPVGRRSVQHFSVERASSSFFLFPSLSLSLSLLLNC